MKHFLYLFFALSLLATLGSISCRKASSLLSSNASQIALDDEADHKRKIPPPPRQGADLLNILVQGQTSHMEIEGNNISINVARDPYLAAASYLRINEMSISPGATSEPSMGDAIDATKPIPITITAENGDKKTYTLQVNFTLEKGNDILKIALQGQADHLPVQYKKDEIYIYRELGYREGPPAIGGLNIDVLQLSPGAHATPTQGTTHNFGQPVKITVTSEDGKKHDYQVYVIYKIQILNGDFEDWYHEGGYNGALVVTANYNNLGKSKADRTGWDSYNDGFWFTNKSSTDYPLMKVSGTDGGSAVRIVTRQYQNTASQGQNLPFGISPGMIFTGRLQNYDQGSKSSGNYRRGIPNYQPIDYKAMLARPKQLSFDYRYFPRNHEPGYSYHQDCHVWWNVAVWNKNPGNGGYYSGWYWGADCNKQNWDGDRMVGYVMFLSADGKLVAIGAFNTNAYQGDWKKQTITFKYKQSELDSTEGYYAMGKLWANEDAIPTQVQVMFTASNRLIDGPVGSPIGVPLTDAFLDNLTLIY